MERIERQPFIREEMRIPDVTDMDGLVSLMGRSMDNEESFHIDLLLASLSRMHPFVKQEDVERMVPVFEMARTVVEGGKDGVGELDVLAASFLLDTDPPSGLDRSVRACLPVVCISEKENQTGQSGLSNRTFACGIG